MNWQYLIWVFHQSPRIRAGTHLVMVPCWKPLSTATCSSPEDMLKYEPKGILTHVDKCREQHILLTCATLISAPYFWGWVGAVASHLFITAWEKTAFIECIFNKNIITNRKPFTCRYTVSLRSSSHWLINNRWVYKLLQILTLFLKLQNICRVKKCQFWGKYSIRLNIGI